MALVDPSCFLGLTEAEQLHQIALAAQEWAGADECLSPSDDPLESIYSSLLLVANPE
jgi:hypothetical protein